MASATMSPPRVVKSQHQSLHAGGRRSLSHIRDGSIITTFDKTPPPTQPTHVVCPHFWELKWATGCPYDCAWCYLKGTLRFLPEKTKPRLKDYSRIQQHVRAFFAQADGHAELLNTGELADSLMEERSGNPFSKFIVSLFREQQRHRVLFVTKSTNIQHLLRLDHQGCAVVSFSLNEDAVARRWEKGAPTVAERIEAAAQLTRAGYEVRIRIDPMVPVPDWEQQYKSLVDNLFSRFAPTRITLGSLRGLQSTINNAHDKSWVVYLTERSNWGKKVKFETRLQMYRSLIEHLRHKYGYTDVALCKETIAIWDALGLDHTKIGCNCTL